MVKRFKNSSANNRQKVKNKYYASKSVYLFTALALIFLIEIISLIYHSGVNASSNEQVERYRKEAIAECDKIAVTPGDISDRNGTALLSYTKPITKDLGTYIDNEAYSAVLGYVTENASAFMLSKYEDVLRQTPTLEDTKGNSLTLTLDHELQMEVYQALKDRIGEDGRGSMVVMDADTGEILSMVSLPTFDVTKRNNVTWYPLAVSGKDTAPGSIFKVISSIVLLENGYEDHTELDASFSTSGGYKIRNYYADKSTQIDYREALKVSSNVFFAKSILSLPGGQTKLTEVAKRFRIGESIICDFGTLTGNWTMDEATLVALQKNDNFDMDYELAASAFGQAEVRMSCTQAAMVAASIINGGKLIMPYMVEKVTDCNGKDVDVEQLGIAGLSSKHGAVIDTVTTEEITSKIQSAMETAAVETYGFDASLKVAAKSGTAETGMSGDDGNNAWMISCAEIQGHKYAIAINWAKAPSSIYGSDMKVPIEKIYRYLQSAR